MIPETPIPLDATAYDERRDPHLHNDLAAEDWPIAAILIALVLAIPFGLGFTLGRIWP